MSKITLILAISILFGLMLSAPCSAQWGDLQGQIVYDGPAPTPEKAKITSDKEVCCKHDVINES